MKIDLGFRNLNEVLSPLISRKTVTEILTPMFCSSVPPTLIYDATPEEIISHVKLSQGKYCVLGGTFRQTKLFMKELEKQNVHLKAIHDTDRYELTFENGSSIIGIPLNERICGRRFSILIAV